MYEKRVLPNGVTVVLDHADGVRSASLGIWVRSGSRYESGDEAGAAHFIEHMLFKGTDKYTGTELAERMDGLGGVLRRKLIRGEGNNRFVEGFVNASVLFCVGAMAIMGALDSGLTGDHATLYAKSTLDGITSIVYGSTMGVGVALSGVAVFLYQGLITLCASFIAPFLSEVVIAEMKCVGSLLIVGLSFNVLGITKIKVMNYVPAVFFPILLCRFM